MGYVWLHSLTGEAQHQHHHLPFISKSSTPRSGMMGSRGAAMPAKGLGPAVEKYIPEG
jgi:hypothetical protein